MDTGTWTGTGNQYHPPWQDEAEGEAISFREDILQIKLEDCLDNIYHLFFILDFF